jgi:diguanylate cyclase (GGDEF)-like protein
MTILFSTCMAVCTLHTFARHEAIAGSLCIMGTFALTSAMSARTTFQPRVLQSCGLIMLGSLGAALLLYASPLLGRAGAMLCLFYAFIHFSAIGTKFEITVEHLRMQHKLRELAERDTLTGLANRRYFHTRLAELCAEISPFAVLYMDLDRFKRVNDTYGHAVGDILLQRVSGRLSALIRSTDLLARLGGDEFAILQHPVSQNSDAQALATRINQEIAIPFEIEGHQVEVGSSVGIRVVDDLEREPSRLLNLADQALYQVKQAGGGGFRIGEFQN